MDEKNQENTSEKALMGFLECWKKRDFKKMVEFVQITWKSDHIDRGNNPEKILRNFYGFKKLIFFEIKDRKGGKEIFIDIEVIIKYSHSGGVFIKKITPRIICETGAYQPNIKGKWGVNPISVLKEI